MKNNTNTRTTIRQIVREEVAMAINEVITELKKPISTTKPFTLIKPAQAGGMPKETTPKPTRKPGRGRSTVGGGVQAVKTVTPEHMKVPKKKSKSSKQGADTRKRNKKRE